MMECPFCGAAIPSGSNRCRNCGHDLVDRPFDFLIGGSDASDTRDEALPKQRHNRDLIPGNDGSSLRRSRPDLAMQDSGGTKPAMDAAAPDSDEAAPEAYALVDCPAAVARGRVFWVEVGLGPLPQDGANDEALNLPPWQTEPFAVTASLHLTNARLWGKKHSLKGAQLKKLYPDWNKFHEVRRSMDPEGFFMNPYLKELFNDDE